MSPTAPAANTPGSVAEAFVAALLGGRRADALALLRPDATWTVDGSDALRGHDAIHRQLAASGASLAVAGPLRVTRGSEVAWPLTETSSEAEGSPRGRVDIVDVRDGGLIASWTTIRAAAPSPRISARTAALLAYVERVGRADAEGALALFAGDCRVEDPVGTPAHEGRAAVESFYRNGLRAITETVLLGEPVVGEGLLGAVPFRVVLDLAERRIAIDVVDVMTFGDDERFASMRAFWGRDNRISL